MVPAQRTALTAGSQRRAKEFRPEAPGPAARASPEPPAHAEDRGTPPRAAALSPLPPPSPSGRGLSATPSAPALLASSSSAGGAELGLGLARPASASGVLSRPSTAGRTLGSLRSAAAEAVIQPVAASHSMTLDLHRRLSKENRKLTQQFAAAIAELQQLRDARAALASRLQASEEELRATRDTLRDSEEAGRRAASVRAAVADISRALARRRGDGGGGEKFGPSSAERLIDAVKEGSLEDLLDLLGEGAHPDAHGFNHKTALHAAAREGRVTLAVALIHAGAAVNSVDGNSRTPFDEASRNRHPLAARVLQDYGGAAFVDLEKEAIQSGGRLRVESGPVEQIHAAAHSNEPDRIRQLVDAGVDASAPDLDRCTPLHRAAAAGHVEAVDILLRLNAAVNAADGANQTPLGAALAAGHADVAKLLKARGARTFEELNRGSIRRAGARTPTASAPASAVDTPGGLFAPTPSAQPPTPSGDPSSSEGDAGGGGARRRPEELTVEIPTPAVRFCSRIEPR
eukprot:tig00000133_g7716.t1